jgi:hypothetical protein
MVTDLGQRAAATSRYDCRTLTVIRLAHFVALKAVLLAASTRFTVLRLDAFPIRAGILIVVHLPVFGQILW